MRKYIVPILLFILSYTASAQKAYKQINEFVADVLHEKIKKELPTGFVTQLTKAVITTMQRSYRAAKKGEKNFTEKDFLSNISSDHLIFYKLSETKGSPYFFNFNYNYQIGESDRELYYIITANGSKELLIDEMLLRKNLVKYKITHFHFTAIDNYRNGLFTINTGGYVKADPDCCPTYAVTYEAKLAGDKIVPIKISSVKAESN